MTTTTTQSPRQHQQLVTLPIASAANTLTNFFFHIIIIANNFRPQKNLGRRNEKYGPSKRKLPTLFPRHCSRLQATTNFQFYCKSMRRFSNSFATHLVYLPPPLPATPPKATHPSIDVTSSFPCGLKVALASPFRHLPASPPRSLPWLPCDFAGLCVPRQEEGYCVLLA